MAIIEKLNIAYAELTQAQKVGNARALMQPIREDVLRVDAALQDIADSGVFTTVDPEIVAALVKAWDVIKAAKTGFEDAEIAELLDWRP